ncbi:MAG: ComEC/Rec2 family competence protein [Acidobacteriota bacterium]|nr:ComEC/Rec2 family competence protein [Acidobacteriota bacterium]
MTRAILVAVVVLGAGLRDLKTPPTNVLAVAAAVLCIVSPLATLEPGFWLTFGATLGIVLG